VTILCIRKTLLVVNKWMRCTAFNIAISIIRTTICIVDILSLATHWYVLCFVFIYYWHQLYWHNDLSYCQHTDCQVMWPKKWPDLSVNVKTRHYINWKSSKIIQQRYVMMPWWMTILLVIIYRRENKLLLCRHLSDNHHITGHERSLIRQSEWIPSTKSFKLNWCNEMLLKLANRKLVTL